jgi:anthranilate phosphoribosyltransferase
MISVRAPIRTIDTCGTGGDKSGTFNISTATAILVSSTGVAVAKHGNRAATSSCGSADVLEALHIPINLDPMRAANSLKQNNFVFLFAPQYHPKLKRFSTIRKQIGFPTIFNLLGPLISPAHVKYQVIGTYSEENSLLMAQVLAKQSTEHTIVLNGENGLDEASLSGDTNIYEVRGRSIVNYKLNAQDYGLVSADVMELSGGDAHLNAHIIKACFKPSTTYTSAQRAVIFNSVIALYVAGKSKSITEGVSLAKHQISTGNVIEQLTLLQKYQ